MLTKRKIIKEIELRSKKEIYERIKIEEMNLIKSSQGRDVAEMAKYENIINTLKWIINDSTQS